MSGPRNVLLHSYFEAGMETIWTIIERDLPVLEAAVNSLLHELPPKASTSILIGPRKPTTGA